MVAQSWGQQGPIQDRAPASRLLRKGGGLVASQQRVGPVSECNDRRLIEAVDELLLKREGGVPRGNLEAVANVAVEPFHVEGRDEAHALAST